MCPVLKTQNPGALHLKRPEKGDGCLMLENITKPWLLVLTPSS